MQAVGSMHGSRHASMVSCSGACGYNARDFVPAVSADGTRYARKENTHGIAHPLYELHVALGAKMVDFGGWDMPLHYGSQVEGTIRSGVTAASSTCPT